MSLSVLACPLRMLVTIPVASPLAISYNKYCSYTILMTIEIYARVTLRSPHLIMCDKLSCNPPSEVLKPCDLGQVAQLDVEHRYPEMEYMALQVKDENEVDLVTHFEKCFEFIERGRAAGGTTFRAGPLLPPPPLRCNYCQI